MKVSTRTRYAFRAMLDLAMHYDTGPVLVKHIAGRQQVSANYLEQILISLKVAALVRSVRGAGGGFTLARQPSEIRLSEIMQVMEGTTAPVGCVDDPDKYVRSSFCAVRSVWVEVKEAMNGVLESLTLQDLVGRQREKETIAATKGIGEDIISTLACDN
jgi:Rrf2 family protein